MASGASRHEGRALVGSATRRRGCTRADSSSASQYLEPAIRIVGEEDHIFGVDCPHPDCFWPDSRRHLEESLGELPERVRRKVTNENVAKLYQLPSRARVAS